MASRNIIFLALLGLLLVAAAPSFAQDEVEDVMEESGVDGELDEEEMEDVDDGELAGGDFEFADGVTTSYVFPASPAAMTFAIGDIIDVVLGLSNGAENDYNVSVIGGYLINPHDPSQILQNLTTFGYNVTVGSGKEGSVLYRFMPDPYRVEPRSYSAVILMQYVDTVDAEKRFQSIVFNSTFTLEEGEEGFDYRTIVTFSTIFALIGSVVYVSFPNKKGKSRRPKVERGAEKNHAADADWAKGVMIDPSKKQGKATKRTGAK
mmetsp:Transcript_1515/g.3025  ORF Transcript_1515/g.3025 Transcript_1515/m.3025 type:complete len:263 (+) Transcript_1515:66-854(+)|eukprot:CAMPEP_0113881476 /NCGR_PEP_ID=MMETSP0780_2-20120614/8397_1 /TAXON_ID=652834 /ORGANISM="Palpitomonas bilix" /LENGTH=262 /DNA_ID=CAMNT_0000868337 /DNA_START=38 /DNA_END=826 /DNA_ORIENTATION=- /assembly_acc=CAM_ASM_000599